MGKLMEGKSAVKRETVSASANLEVVSEEKFAKRLEGISSSCMSCQKERKGQRRHSQKGKRKQVKTNTPIVIHLKDTLKAALQQRQRSLEEDSEASVKSGDSEMSHDQEDVVTCIPKYSLREVHKDKTRDFKKHHHSKSKKKDNKNLNALISVIEKAHLKDSKTIECNLAKDNPLLDTKLSDMLNNATRSSEIDGAKRRSIVECENVELICNDLYNTEKQLESLDDTESDKSSVASSSENYSVSDSDSIQIDDSVPFEFTPEELEKLANYTTGFPLIRYDCPPSECPECLSAWYSYQYYTIQDYSFQTEKKSSPVSHHTSHNVEPEEDFDSVDVDVLGATAAVDSDKTLTEIDCELETDEEIEFEADHVTATQYQKTHRQLWDIDISSQRRHKPDHSFPDSVYIDLTGTDVSLSVYYHHNQSSQDVNYANSHGGRSSHGTTWYPPPQTVPNYYWPPSYYQLPLYSHHHLSSPFIHSNSASLPKTAMVPPRELKKFNASAPPPRQWTPMGQPDRNKPAAIFTVMCYNVLCDKYCTRQQYGYCPSWALNWEYRKKGIMDEIRTCSADIISLQEVETNMFYNMFLPELKQDGYDGIFAPKSRARTMTEQERKHVDGCAIFFRTSKFTLVKKQLIEFNQLAMANAEGHDDMLNRVMTKDNIGLAALLETKEAVYDHNGPKPTKDQIGQPVLVATAHIHWDPEYSDVKLIQTMMLMSELRQVIEDASQISPGLSPPTDCNNIPLILCGDLNSLPDSGVVEYLTSGKVAANHEDFKEILYATCLTKINTTLEKESFSHNFKLSRAYGDVMPYTNYTYDFKGIIDYIFFSRDHMNLLGLLGPLDEDWVRQNKVIGCPHPHIPSDHFSLFVEFEMPVSSAQNGRSTNSNSSSNSSNSNNSSSGNNSGSTSSSTTGKAR